jgi:hypothetical protein
MYREEDRLIRKLAASQHGVVSWDQALDLFPPRAGRRHLSPPIWERDAPEVYRLVGSQETWHQAVMMACLTVGAGAVASHRTAAALHRLKGFGPATIDVTTHRWERRHRTDFRVHESLDLCERDVTVVDGIRCTTVERTLIDLGAVCHPVKVARALDDRRRTDPGLLDRVRRRNDELRKRGRRGCGVMRRLLATRPGGDIPSKSVLEDLFVALFEKHGIHLVRNYEVREGDRVAYIDLAAPEHRYGIEIDSVEHHLDQERFVADRRRNNWLRRIWHIDQYTYADLQERPLEVVTEVLAYLGDEIRPSATQERQG